MKLNDYSGPFRASLSYEDFSRDLMLRALRMYGEQMRVLDGMWYLSVKEKAGDDMAAACDMAVWHMMEVRDVEMTRELFNIEGNDVAAMFKCLQMNPWSWTSDHHFDLKDSEHGIWTVTRCPTLLALEKEGEGRERRVCGLIDTDLLQVRAHAVNPKMKAVPMKLPPRKSKHELHCQWEFRIEE